MFWETFVALCQERGEKPTPVIKKLGIAVGLVTKWKNGTMPGSVTLSKIANYFGVSVDYLLGKTDAKEKSPDVFIGAYEKYGIKPVNTKKIRMIGNVACGEPIYADEDYETWVDASSDIKADFCLTAQGDSMINARIFDGDIVFIKAQNDVDNGEIAAIIIGEEVTLKRVYKYENRIELRPENPMHRVLNYEGEQLNQIRILGKAVAFQSYVR